MIFYIDIVYMAPTMKLGGKKRKLTPWIQAAKAYWPMAKKGGMSYSKMLSSNEFREFYKENYEGKASVKGGASDETPVDETPSTDFMNPAAADAANANKAVAGAANAAADAAANAAANADANAYAADAAAAADAATAPPAASLFGGKKSKKSKKSAKKSAKKSRKTNKKRFFGLM